MIGKQKHNVRTSTVSPSVPNPVCVCVKERKHNISVCVRVFVWV